MSNNQPTLKWTSFPLVDFPATSLFLILFLILFSFFFYRITFVSWEMPLFFYLGMGFFVVSLIPYFIPTTYEFNEEKLIITYFVVTVEKEYGDFKSFYADKKGIMLCTFRRPSRLDSFRGQSIRFSKTQSEKTQLIAFLSEKIGKKHV